MKLINTVKYLWTHRYNTYCRTANNALVLQLYRNRLKTYRSFIFFVWSSIVRSCAQCHNQLLFPYLGSCPIMEQACRLLGKGERGSTREAGYPGALNSAATLNPFFCQKCLQGLNSPAGDHCSELYLTGLQRKIRLCRVLFCQVQLAMLQAVHPCPVWGLGTIPLSIEKP